MMKSKKPRKHTLSTYIGVVTNTDWPAAIIQMATREGIRRAKLGSEVDMDVAIEFRRFGEDELFVDLTIAGEINGVPFLAELDSDGNLVFV